MDESKTMKELQSVKEWFTEHGRNTNTAVIGICERAIDLINRKNERFAELTKQFNIQGQEYDRLYKESLQLKSEIERLQKLIDDNCDVCIERERANGRAEGIKEVLEKVKEVICSQTYPAFDADGKPVNVWRAKPGYDAIAKIAKEMGGRSCD